jgi:hypothetical protein
LLKIILLFTFMNFSSHVVQAQITDLTSKLRILTQISPKSNSIIDGVWISNPNGACIVINAGVKNVIIRNSVIGPCGVSGMTDYGVFILDGAENIVVSNNEIFNVATGVKAHNALHPVIVERNFFHGIRGPLWSGQAVQFNSVHGYGASSLIKCNVSDAWYGNGQKSYEDHISIFKSQGTEAFPIQIVGNRIRGGTSKSGGGITVGDKGGAWIVVKDNTVVTVANSGIGVAGGTNISILKNRVDNRGSDSSSLTHIAYFTRALSQCSDITLEGNRGISRLWNWGEVDGRTVFGYRGGPEACSNVTLTDNNFSDYIMPKNLFDIIPSSCD